MSKHRSTTMRVDAARTEAACTRVDRTTTFCLGPCPRHWPVDYADMMARHATDSIPVAAASREHGYHTGNGWGR